MMGIFGAGGREDIGWTEEELRMVVGYAEDMNRTPPGQYYALREARALAERWRREGKA